jgi:hypothetical protein
MGVLPLLADGSCQIQGTCLKSPGEAHGQCPQAFKCGTCVAWSPREENSYTRNSGECMLNRDARHYLDCNAQICPYYRPRRTTAAFEEWKAKPPATGQRKQATRSGRRRVKMDRDVPPPSAAALATAAFADHPAEVAEVGQALLEAELEARGTMPVLLERFRGGTVRVEQEGGPTREVSMEAFYARLVAVRRSLNILREAVEDSGLGAGEKDKALKDLGGINGSMTTFNLLFADKGDHFKGSSSGKG